jgi:hypothetical protein
MGAVYKAEDAKLGRFVAHNGATPAVNSAVRRRSLKWQ